MENTGLACKKNHPFDNVLYLGPARLCEAAGTGSRSPTPPAVQAEAGGSRRAAGPGPSIPGQEGDEAQEEGCDPPAGPHQRCAGKKGSQKVEKRREFNLNNYESSSPCPQL